MTLKKIATSLAFVSAASLTFSNSVLAGTYEADETSYPVIFAHGMAGFDSIAGYHYFGEDGWGTFIGDACSFMELNGCNDWIAWGQQARDKAEAFQVTSLNSSEVRGEELYNHVRNFMATTGYNKVSLVGHSQGGFDIRKAAHRLKDNTVNGVAAGTVKVGAMISISSPHRGSPYAQKIMDKYSRNNNDEFCGILPPLADGSDPCGEAIVQIGDILFDFATGSTTAGNDIIQAGLQLIYDDYEPNDGIATGAKVFNQNYGSEGVAGYVGSIVTGQDDGNLSPILGIVGAAINFNADGDGYCVDDCNNSGAAGQGDGNTYDMDDDGLVGINSQQMGHRIQYNPDDCRGFLCVLGNPLDTFSQVGATGYVADINNPNSTQMTSHTGKLSQDHLDVISLGPDTLDEEEFYAAMFQFIKDRGY